MSQLHVHVTKDLEEASVHSNAVLQIAGLYSRSAQVPQTTNFCLWVAGKTDIMGTGHQHDVIVKNL